MPKVKVSVIIPVYNMSAYIERCARSLFEQTLDDMEYIFVDDCSSDNSVGILERVVQDYIGKLDASRVRIVRHPRNEGVSIARNTGLNLAVGDYIAYCDADDYPSASMYEKLYDQAIKADADVVYCDFWMDDQEGKHYYATPECMDDKTTFLRRYIASGWTVLWNMIAKRDLYLAYGLQCPGHITYCEDFHLSVRLLYHARKIIKVNEALYDYNQRNQSSAMRNRGPRQEKDEQTVCLDLIDFFSKEGVLADYKQEMSWRVLKSKQEMVLDPERHAAFLQLYPESHDYIDSCPNSFCNRKIRLMMRLLARNKRWMVLVIICFRKLLGR